MLEYSFHRKFSACLTYEKGKFSHVTSSTGYKQEEEIYNVSGWGISPQIRYYPFTTEKRSPLGFFIGLNYCYRELNEFYNGLDYSRSYARPLRNPINSTATSYAGGVDFGYKVNMGLLVVEFLVGYRKGTVNWFYPGGRESIDPEIRNNSKLVDNSLRLELSAGFVFPKVKTDRVLTHITDYVETMEPDKQNVAQVVIYRPRRISGWQISYNLTANDSLITEVTNGSSFTYTVKPGKVEFKARTESMTSLTLFVEKGKTYYLRCGFRDGVFIKQPKLELMNPGKGRYELNNL